MLIIILGVIAGAATAWVLNMLFSEKVENKFHRIVLQLAAYIVFMLLGFIFTSMFSLRITLDVFINNRIQAMETSLVQMFPNKNILETSFNTGELASINDQIQKSINEIDTKNDSFFEKMVFKAFVGRLLVYINAFDTGVNTLTDLSEADGSITIKAILYGLKDKALNTASPYIKIIQILIGILFFASTGIYIGLAFFIQKNKSTNDKSVVFGNIDESRF